MSAGVPRIQPSSSRTLPGLGGGRGIPGLSPLPPERSGRSRWFFWLVLVPLLLVGLTFVLGRTAEPMRQRLVGIPLAGKLLFADPVWPILWNKPVTAALPASRPANKVVAGTTGMTDLEAQIADRLTKVEQREAAVAQREAALKTAEPEAAARQSKLDQDAADLATLQVQLKGQLQTELDRVAVIRGMKSASVLQLFGAMSDTEVIAVVKYMQADEVGKILSGMDQTRAARLLRLMQFAPVPSTP